MTEGARSASAERVLEAARKRARRRRSGVIDGYRRKGRQSHAVTSVCQFVTEVGSGSQFEKVGGRCS